MNTNRRKFLKRHRRAHRGRGRGRQRFGLGRRERRGAGGADYKALVCVFLFGGNDCNNMIVPDTDYAQYAASPHGGVERRA